jgi:NADH-quinone oxidoreductase subunit L
MTIPLVILAVLSIVGGWVGLPEHWLWGNASASSWHRHGPSAPSSTAGCSARGADADRDRLAIAGATLAYVFYVRMPGMPMVLSWRLRGLYELLLDKYRVDELYDAIIVRRTSRRRRCSGGRRLRSSSTAS